MRQHSVTNKTLFTLFFLLLREHDSFELRNCASVSHYLHAVKGGIPINKVKPKATSESLLITTNGTPKPFVPM
jgi:hypothetical protein